jgi:hypothetical protein
MSGQLIKNIAAVALLDLSHNISGIQILVQISVQLIFVVFFVF